MAASARRWPGLPPIEAAGQGGLLDVITDRDFASNRTVYFCYSEPARLAGLGQFDRAGRRPPVRRRHAGWNGSRCCSASGRSGSRAHFGCRIVDAGDGTLFLTLGDRFSRMNDAQTLDNHHGKMVRVRKDGSVPADNPFVKRPGALPEIWSYGPPQPARRGAGPDGRLWTSSTARKAATNSTGPRPARTTAGL